MQNDLISRSALIEELHHIIEGDADLRKDYEFMGIDDCIKSIPTAFNAEEISCNNCNHVMTAPEKEPCSKCKRNYQDMWEPVRKQTNAERIRAMSEEELAEFLVDVETHGYHDQSVSGTLEMIDWLQSEVE